MNPYIPDARIRAHRRHYAAMRKRPRVIGYTSVCEECHRDPRIVHHHAPRPLFDRSPLHYQVELPVPAWVKNSEQPLRLHGTVYVKINGDSPNGRRKAEITRMLRRLQTMYPSNQSIEVRF